MVQNVGGEKTLYGEGGVGGQKVIRCREKRGACRDDKVIGGVEAVVGGAGACRRQGSGRGGWRADAIESRWKA